MRDGTSWQILRYPPELLRLVKGDIEKTAADNKNSDIALLRLDTDIYYSTKAELEHFYPKLQEHDAYVPPPISRL